MTTLDGLDHLSEEEFKEALKEFKAYLNSPEFKEAFEEALKHPSMFSKLPKADIWEGSYLVDLADKEERN